MIKRLIFLAGLAALSLAACQPDAAHAQGISQKVAVCNPSYTSRCAAPDASGALPVTLSGSTGTSSVNVAQVNGVTTSTGAGATGTGTQRVGVAQDTTTIAGSAPGTAGAASASVVTVQGVASMTPVLVQTGTINATASGAAVAIGIEGSSGSTLRTPTAISSQLSSTCLGCLGVGLSAQLDDASTGAVAEDRWAPLRMASDRVLLVHEGGNSFVNITTNTDTNVKATPGTIVGFSVNTAGTTSTLKLYNDADGTCSSGLIGTFSTLGQASLQIGPILATVGICAQTAGGAAADVTIYYR